MNKLKSWIWCFIVLAALVSGCQTNTITDVNVAMPERNWSYVNKIKAVVEITDPGKSYSLYFRLRHTADYGYSNIYILMSLKAPGQKKVLRRYGYDVAEPDGRWLGSGSGNLFTHNFPMLTHYRFPGAGKYEVQIEQNMRDNPLKEISDVGFSISVDPVHD